MPSASPLPSAQHLNLLEQLALPVFLLAPSDAVTYANPAAAHWLGLSLRRLVGRDPGDWLASISAEAVRTAAARTRREGRRVVVSRVRVELESGDERFADLTFTEVPDAASGVVLLEAVPVAEFAGSDPAHTLPAALHASLRGLAHEVRNPLAGLRGAAQLLARRVEDDDARRYVEVIRAETDRLHALVERLLSPTPLQPLVAVNLHEVVERVRFLIDAEGGWAVRVVRDYDPSLPNVAADADRLIQAVLNLARNALEAGASELKLRTRVEYGARIGDASPRQSVRLDIVDNGRGVPHLLNERVFLPLVSGRSDGTGLGLTIAQEIAREHAGSLSFRSRPGHTVFTLLLPVPVHPSADEPIAHSAAIQDSRAAVDRATVAQSIEGTTHA